MYEGLSQSLRQKYLGSSTRGGFHSNADTNNYTDDSQLENIYKKKVIRLEIEISELRKENESMKQTNQQQKQQELLLNSRINGIEKEKYDQFYQEHDRLIRDVSDLARGNRLLSQENDVLTQKYSNLLEVYNKVILSNNSNSKLADIYSNQIENRTRALKEHTSDKWEDFSELNSDYEQNKRKINEVYSNLKGKTIQLQAENKIHYDTKEQWKHHAEDLQDTFDYLHTLYQDQSDLHSKIIITQQIKNRELQQKYDPKNQNRQNDLTPIHENQSDTKRIKNLKQGTSNRLSSKESKKIDTQKRPKTASGVLTETKKFGQSSANKLTGTIKPKTSESKLKISSSPSKTNLISSKSNLGATKIPGMKKLNSQSTLAGVGEESNKATKSKVGQTNKHPSMVSSSKPNINVFGVNS